FRVVFVIGCFLLQDLVYGLEFFGLDRHVSGSDMAGFVDESSEGKGIFLTATLMVNPESVCARKTCGDALVNPEGKGNTKAWNLQDVIAGCFQVGEVRFQHFLIAFKRKPVVRARGQFSLEHLRVRPKVEYFENGSAARFGVLSQIKLAEV